MSRSQKGKALRIHKMDFHLFIVSQHAGSVTFLRPCYIKFMEKIRGNNKQSPKYTETDASQCSRTNWKGQLLQTQRCKWKITHRKNLLLQNYWFSRQCQKFILSLEVFVKAQSPISKKDDIVVSMEIIDQLCTKRIPNIIL